MPTKGSNTANPGGGAPTAVSRMQVTAPGTADSETVNYTGAVISAPTGWTQYQSNATVTAANSPTDALGPTAAATTKQGFILCSDSGAPLPLDSIAAGNWAFQFDWGGNGTLGPTVQVAVRAFQVSASLGTMTAITLPGATSSGYVLSGNLTTSATGQTITCNSTGAVTLASGTPHLYIEWALRVVTGGTNLVANPQTISVTGISTIPAIALSRAATETITAASDGVGQIQVLARSLTETITAASDTPTRTYAADRSVTETITAASDVVDRLFVGTRDVPETITAASDSVVRSFIGTRDVTETTTASDTVDRIYLGARDVTETIPATTDAAARIFIGLRDVPESITAADDSVIRTYLGARDVTESITAASDSVIRVLTAVRDITETITAADDSVVRVATFNRDIPESVPAASDSPGRVVAAVRDITETIPAASDSVGRVVTFIRGVNEDLLVCPPCPPGVLPSLVLVDGELAKRIGSRLFTKV